MTQVTQWTSSSDETVTIQLNPTSSPAPHSSCSHDVSIRSPSPLTKEQEIGDQLASIWWPLAPQASCSNLGDGMDVSLQKLEAERLNFSTRMLRQCSPSSGNFCLRDKIPLAV
ncbi:hypothetical protein CEXT_771581 [Caerostris extrusa]|uniref:Uncharacterized protein n=1 Tax=Caerostris extrusa TaxID=172846 RepID=A0AAV4YDP4_CAEEX|nr:hypothetical protein CEXT_771581 [Caerostris extrusa]